MSIIQVKGTGRNLAERSSFYGSSVPLEVKRSIKPLKKLDQQTFRSLLQGMVCFKVQFVKCKYTKIRFFVHHVLCQKSYYFL